MMKSRKPMLSALTAAALLFAGTLIAQDAPPPPPPPAQAMPAQAMPPPASTAANAAVGQAPSAQTTQGQTTVASVPPPKPTIGPAPPFEQLSDGRFRGRRSRCERFKFSLVSFANLLRSRLLCRALD